jgi:predicted hydrocarbon binding protein
VDTIITISGADKAGASAQILTFLVRQGYGLKDHQITQAPSGSRHLKIRFDHTELDRTRLAAEIKSLNQAYSVVQAPGQSATDLVKEMAGKFPDIAQLVQEYGASFGSESRDQGLFEAGKKIGAFNYAREWAFGNPLKMPQALRRALLPALNKMSKLEATDTDISFLDSRFCATGAQVHCCEFLSGFMRGFLDASPTTKDTKVQKVGCAATGAAQCRYAIVYDVRSEGGN